MRLKNCCVMLLVGVSACATLQDKLTPGQERLVGAQPIETQVTLSGKTYDLVDVIGNRTTDNVDSKTYIGLILRQSESSCHAFLSRISASQKGADFTLDVLTTLFSALGTAFTPIATVHAFTSAASFTTGTRASYNADIFAKETVPLIRQEIDNTYYKAYSAYAEHLSQMSAVNPVIELNVINAFHSQCSLDYAIAALTAIASKSTSTTRHDTTGDDIKIGAVISAADGTAYVINGMNGDSVTYLHVVAGKPFTTKTDTQANLLKAINAPTST